MDILQKLQKQPERTRKIILWSVVAAVAFILFLLYINFLKERLSAFNLRALKSKLPSIEMPK